MPDTASIIDAAASCQLSPLLIWPYALRSFAIAADTPVYAAFVYAMLIFSPMMPLYFSLLRFAQLLCLRFYARCAASQADDIAGFDAQRHATQPR